VGRRWNAALVVHVTTAVGLLGATASQLVAAAHAATRDDPSDAHAVYDHMRAGIFGLGIPLSFLALGSGVLMGLTSRWGLLRHWWVTTKLALLVTTILAGALATGPRVDSLLDATAAGGSGGDERWGLVVSLACQVALVLAASVLAVFKPGGRTPWAGTPR
jgi:hypothetical protein